MTERDRKEAAGEEYRRTVKPVWAIVTVQGILDNDFYIGTLRQGKYTRKKINGKEVKQDELERAANQGERNVVIRAMRTVELVSEVLDDVLSKKKLEKNDCQLIIEKIKVYEDRIEIWPKPEVSGFFHYKVLAKWLENKAKQISAYPARSCGY